MTFSDILIIVIWVSFLGGALTQGLAIPQLADETRASVEDAPVFIYLVGLLFPFAFFSPTAFSQRKYYAFDVQWIRNMVDAEWGVGSYDRFISRLRPTALFIFGCLLSGTTGVSTYLTTQTPSGYPIGGFFLSAGLGVLAAFLLSIRFPPRLE
jgi:hypothetical protein